MQIPFFLEGANYDSLFFYSLKNYFFLETTVYLKGDYYTQFTITENPENILYVSYADKIREPSDYSVKWDTNEQNIRKEENLFIEKGYQTFCYKAYATSATKLRIRYNLYAKESVAFIVFHELMHNVLFKLKLEIPNSFREAICDVVGNYASIKYSERAEFTDLNAVIIQVNKTEEIYKCINFFCSKIELYPRFQNHYHKKCEKQIQVILTDADLYQKDRFDYHVNNAYLLKNRYYSRHYFLLKEVLYKSTNIKSFIEIIKKLPPDEDEAVELLKKYLMEK